MLICSLLKICHLVNKLELGFLDKGRDSASVLPPPAPLPLATADLFTVSVVLPLPKCHIIGIIQYVAFSKWPLSLSNMHVGFLHVFSA